MNEKKNIQKVITIDGPSASGKGTVAMRVAQKLGFHYLDSGALYRLTALYAEKQNINWADEAGLALLAQSLPVRFDEGHILLGKGSDEIDASELIRTEAIGLGASAVAKFPLVREALLARQHAFLTEQGLVADGRDMGSVVFPHAFLKIFLTASAEVRANRRVLQLEGAGKVANYAQILQDLKDRDFADQNRAVAPLKKLPEAYLLDTSNLNIEESVTKVLQWYQQTKI